MTGRDLNRVTRWIHRWFPQSVASELELLGQRFVWLALYRLGTLLATFAGSAWVLRCLGAEQAGISGFVLAVTQQLVLGSSILPNHFLVREIKQHPDHSHLLQAILVQRLSVSLGIVLLGGVGLWILRPEPSWNRAVWLAFPLVVVLALRSQWYLQARENQLLMYRNQFIGALVALLGFLIFLRKGALAYHEILITVLSATLITTLNLGTLKHGLILRPQCRSLFPYLKDSIRRARWLYFTTLFISFYVTFQVPLVGILLDMMSMGIYRAAFLAVTAFHSFSLIIPLLLYPRFIDWHRQGSDLLWKRQMTIFLSILGVGLLVCLVAAAIAPALFPVIFGSEYSAAAWPFVLLLVSKLVVVLNGIFAYGLWAQQADRAMFYITLVAAVFSLVLSVMLVPAYGVNAAAGIAILSESLILLLTVWESRRRLRNDTAGPPTNTERAFYES